MKKTLYDYLGLDTKASVEEVEAGYQFQKARLINAADQDSQNELKFVRQAFTVLSDQKQRIKYDLSLESIKSQNEPVIYYANEVPGSSHVLMKLAILSILAFAGYEGYQHYFPGHNNADANTMEVSALPASKAIPETSSVPSNAATKPNETNQPAVIQQAAEPAPQQPAVQETSTSDINDVSAVPIPVTEKQIGAYKSFLALSNPRAFVICSNGSVMTLKGNETFVQNKLATLPQGCAPYAVNDDVVWKK